MLERGEALPIAIVHGAERSGTTHLGDETGVRPHLAPPAVRPGPARFQQREELMREFAGVARNAASPIRYARAKLNSTDFG